MLRIIYRRRIGWSFVLALGLVPSVCWGNGWISGVNSFRQTPEFYFLFASILLVEMIALWVWFRPMNLGSVLWRVLVVNVVSSLAGDVLFRLDWGPCYSEVWKQAIPFFLLTVALEIPLLWLLCRKSVGSWKRVVLAGMTANVVSYALLIAIERPVQKVWREKLCAEDQAILNRWNNTEMLKDATGRIYATESKPGEAKHRLKYFDFTDRQWHSVSNSPAIDPRYWHVEGDLFAFFTFAEPSTRGIAKLTTLPDCKVIRDFTLPPVPQDYGSYWDIAVSPDRSRLAVLVPQHEIRGSLSDSSHQILGKTCLLVVINIGTGEMSICPRKASHSLCWMPDSRRILFHSLQDEKLHEAWDLPKGWQKKYDSGRADDLFVKVPLFSYDCGNGTVEMFGEFSSPCLAADAGLLGFKEGNEALGFLEGDSKHSRIKLGAMGRYSDIALSPDGRFVLVPLVLSWVGYWGYPTIVDLRDTSRRYYFGWNTYRVVWARE